MVELKWTLLPALLVSPGVQSFLIRRATSLGATRSSGSGVSRRVTATDDPPVEEQSKITRSTMPAPKKFLNDPSSAVDEFVSGLLLQYPNHLRKLAGHNVVLHGSFDLSGGGEHPNLSKVSLLSGGGSGHEPAHAGYIGENMLSGAILGGIFVS